jgi:hypothetical protein
MATVSANATAPTAISTDYESDYEEEQKRVDAEHAENNYGRVEFDKSAELRQVGVAQRILEQSKEELCRATLASEKDPSNVDLQEQLDCAIADVYDAEHYHLEMEVKLGQLEDAEKWVNREK